MSAEALPISSTGGKTRYLFAAALVLGLDQLTKYWAAAVLSDREDIHVVRGLLKLSYTENPGIAFGMLSSGNFQWALVAISIAAILVVGFYLIRTSSSNKLLLWSLALLSAGISGNLVDRIRMGRVIDFIELYFRDFHWPVFNIADSAITIGAALMAIELFLTPPVKGEEAQTVNEE